MNNYHEYNVGDIAHRDVTFKRWKQPDAERFLAAMRRLGWYLLNCSDCDYSSTVTWHFSR